MSPHAEHAKPMRLALVAAFVALAVLVLGAVPAAKAHAADGARYTAADSALTTNSSKTGKGVLAPGTYYMASVFKGSNVVTVGGDADANGSSAQLAEVEGGKMQQWVVTVDSKGYARFKNKATNKVLTVQGGTAKNGAKLVQWKSLASMYRAQRFIVKKQGSHCIVLSVLNKNFVVNVNGKYVADGNGLFLKKRNNNVRQLFDFATEASSTVKAGKKTVKNGTYLLCAKAAPKRPVSIEEGSKDSGANANIWLAYGSPSQAFKLKYDGEGFYTVTNVNSKKKLAVAAALAIPGVNVGQYKLKSDDRAKWRIDKVSGGYRFVNKACGLVLDVADGKNANGTNVQVWKKNKKPSQTFKLKTQSSITPSPKGVFFIAMNAKQSRVLGFKNSDRTEKGNVVLRLKKDTNLERFRIQAAGEGLYYVKSIATGRFLTVYNPNKEEGSTAIMRDKTGKDAQKWKITFNDDFTVSFTNAASGLALNIDGAGTALNTNVNTAKADHSDAQKFTLLPTEKQVEKVMLKVPCYMQNPQLPTGCESVALTNALRYWGFDLAKTTIANSYMPYGSNGVTNFIGNPRNSSGWIICAPGIEKTADNYLAKKKTSVRAVNKSGTSLKGLRRYLDKGYPVVVWTTMYMGSPYNYSGSHYYDGYRYPFYHNNHAVVLSGYNPKTGQYRIADSLSGVVWRSGGSFTRLYNAMGKQAVVLADGAV